jgi:DNA-binding transcriptional MerR regulator
MTTPSQKSFIGEFARRHEVSAEYVRQLDNVLQPERVGNTRVYTPKHDRIFDAYRHGERSK